VTAEKPTTTVGLYARVSTTGQTAENQLLALRAFARARGWTVVEYIDHGVSGARETRPQLDRLLTAARQRKVDVIACTKLDRLARACTTWWRWCASSRSSAST
jgi:DNA invertase Pin-like site-specific DNA recombinase